MRLAAVADRKEVASKSRSLDPALRPVHGPSEGEQPEDPDHGRDVVQARAEAGAVGVVSKGKARLDPHDLHPIGEVGGQEPAPRVYTVAETEDDGGGEQQVEHRQVQDEVGIVDRHPRQPHCVQEPQQPQPRRHGAQRAPDAEGPFRRQGGGNGTHLPKCSAARSKQMRNHVV